MKSKLNDEMVICVKCGKSHIKPESWPKRFPPLCGECDKLWVKNIKIKVNN